MIVDMIKMTHQKYLLATGAITATLLILVYRFGYVPVRVCSEVIPKLLISCAGLMNLGIQLGSVVILAILAFFLLRRLKIAKPFTISLFALLMLWDLSDLVFWPGTYWFSLVLYVLLGTILFILSDLYFNRLKMKTWIKVSFATLLFCFLFIFAPALHVYIDRQLMMSIYLKQQP